MSLKLMYITNCPKIASVAQENGVDRIFVDLEYIGKELRQGGMDTVKSKHTLDDVKAVSEVLTCSELLVRINPIHEKSEDYCSSEEEINMAIENGADILMLPYFKTIDEVKKFVQYVGGRVRTMLLIETPEAVELVDEILELKSVDELYVGLNDLSLGYGKKFMFEILADGTVDRIVSKIKAAGIPFGFGGLAALEGGLVPGKMILGEHYRLGSTSVILSRSFCNANVIKDIEEIKKVFELGVQEIRKQEKLWAEADDYSENRKSVCQAVEKIVGEA